MNRTFFFELSIAGAFILSACQPAPPATSASTQTTFASQTAQTGTTSSPTSDQVLIAFDDDGSPDGTSALLYFLADPQAYVVSASIAFGEAYPSTYIQHVGRILDDFGITDIPLGAGDAAPLAGNNHFPEWIHDAASAFWGLPLPNADKTYPVTDAALLMISTIHKSAEPVTVFISGPCTNFARALRLDPDIKGKIQAVYIMGGAIHVRGNLDDLVAETGNTTAEWNIYADPLAAKEVFESGLDVYLVPLDATNQVKINGDDIIEWRKGSEISDLAAKIYEVLMQTTGKSDFMIWDLMTAAISVDPDLCTFEDLKLGVEVDPGVNSGQTVVDDSSDAMINVCLEPDVASIRQALIDIFSQN